MIQYFNRLKNCVKNTISNYKKKKTIYIYFYQYFFYFFFILIVFLIKLIKISLQYS